MKAIKIQDRLVGQGCKCFIIAEAGVNHNGSIQIAKKLVDAAKSVGADAIKFQTFKTDDLLIKNSPKAKYHHKSCPTTSQYDMLKELELSQEEFIEISKYAKKRNITFLSSPFDKNSVDILDEIGVPLFKIASGEITNIPLLRYVAEKGKPVILSTGMANLGEIEEAVFLLNKNLKDIILLHCVTIYPAKTHQVNLNVMRTLRSAFRLPVGFSDHTLGYEMSIAAVAMGSCIIEKHLTIDRDLNGPDHKASLEPHELHQMIQSIRNVEKGLGKGVKDLSEEENEIKLIARKSVTALSDIPEGTVITKDMLSVKRPGTGIKPKYLDTVIGKTSTENIKAGEVLKWNMIRN